MSHEIWVSPDGSVTVSSYIGPSRSDPGAPRSRVRYQVAVVSEQDGKHHTASVDADELLKLFHALGDELARYSKGDGRPGWHPGDPPRDWPHGFVAASAGPAGACNVVIDQQTGERCNRFADDPIHQFRA